MAGGQRLVCQVQRSSRSRRIASEKSSAGEFGEVYTRGREIYEELYNTDCIERGFRG